MIKDDIHNFHNFKINDIIKIKPGLNLIIHKKNYTELWKIVGTYNFFPISQYKILQIQSLFDNEIISVNYTNIQLDNKYMRNLKIKKLNTL